MNASNLTLSKSRYDKIIGDMKTKFCKACKSEIPKPVRGTNRGRVLCSDCFTIWFCDDVRLEVGREAYEVEWCVDLPSDGCGGCLPDKAKYKRRLLRCRQFAERFAKVAYLEDKFGAVLITPVVGTDPHAGTQYEGIKSLYRWEPIGDATEYSGTDAE